MLLHCSVSKMNGILEDMLNTGILQSCNLEVSSIFLTLSRNQLAGSSQLLTKAAILKYICCPYSTVVPLLSGAEVRPLWSLPLHLCLQRIEDLSKMPGSLVIKF